MKNTILNKNLPEIIFITSYPPRECGIATYTQDLIAAIQNKFEDTFHPTVCAIETKDEKYNYPGEVTCKLETDNKQSYIETVHRINANQAIKMVVVQHEFGLFASNEDDFIAFLNELNKPIVIAFHTILPKPNKTLKQLVQSIGSIVKSIIVMTKSSATILIEDYELDRDKIEIIAHGTHLVHHLDKAALKEKYNISQRKTLATFGLLNSGKSIETTIEALRIIVKRHPDVLFLVIGKTHPTVIKQENERYREILLTKIKELKLEKNVQFINQYLSLDELLEYLQLTDIYLFTSKDRNQAVSGTFSYALSCGCPIISTPIPHAVETLQNGTGIIIDFENPKQLARKVIELLDNDELCRSISANGIHKQAPTAWENSALRHTFLFEKTAEINLHLDYKIPEINLNHFHKLTTDFGMLQFSIINKPDIHSGYTLDDNARALVAMCMHYEVTKNEKDLEYISIYFNFIKKCHHPEGYFLNYLDIDEKFTTQNQETNLSDSNGRAIWALGYLIAQRDLLPEDLIEEAIKLMKLSMTKVVDLHSPRAIAFIIKGIYYSHKTHKTADDLRITKHLADKLVQMYKHEATEDWQWFESYLTYGNSILPEAMLCAYITLGNPEYKIIATTSFEFLLSKIFSNDSIKVISNKGWMYKNGPNKNAVIGGEQPIDIAYTILALSKFYDVFSDENYLIKMKTAFQWFLGKNHLNQIVYNPCTGGCYDGLEEAYINLNQGAESTVSYLLARLTIGNYFETEQNITLRAHIRSKKRDLYFHKKPLLLPL